MAIRPGQNRSGPEPWVYACLYKAERFETFMSTEHAAKLGSKEWKVTGYGRLTPRSPEQLSQPDTGSEQSQPLNLSSPVHSPNALLTVKDRKKPGLKLDMSTIKSSSVSKAQSDLARSEEFSQAIGKAREVLRQMSTSGRKTPESPTANLKSVLSRSNAIRKQTGNQSKLQPKKVVFKPFHQTSMFVVITSSEESARIMQSVLLWNGPVTFSGEEPVLENLDEPGMKPAWRLTLKTRKPSGGTVTKVNNMLLSTSFEDLFQFHTYYDGLIGILYEWSAKDLPCHLYRQKFGLPPI